MKNNTSTYSGSKSISIDFDTFMLEKPEPLKFTVHNLGVKGTMKRAEIYEDEQGDKNE